MAPRCGNTDATFEENEKYQLDYTNPSLYRLRGAGARRRSLATGVAGLHSNTRVLRSWLVQVPQGEGLQHVL